VWRRRRCRGIRAFILRMWCRVDGVRCADLFMKLCAMIDVAHANELDHFRVLGLRTYRWTLSAVVVAKYPLV